MIASDIDVKEFHQAWVDAGYDSREKILDLTREAR